MGNGYTYEFPDAGSYIRTIRSYLAMYAISETASLLEGASCVLSTSGRYTGDDHWDCTVHLHVPMSVIRHFDESVREEVRQAANDVMPREAGFDVIEISVSPDLDGLSASQHSSESASASSKSPGELKGSANRIARVFISYSHGDSDFVQLLSKALGEAGVEAWQDDKTIPPGTPNWESAIRQGIDGADTLLYIGSETAKDSKYVLAEVAIAESKRKRVISLWVRGNQWSECAPLGLVKSQYIDMRAENYGAGLVRLLKALGMM